MFQVIFRGAHVVDPLNGRNGVFDVAVQDGKIAEVAPQITGKAETEYDFSGKVLQPGIIDSHVHLGSMWGSFYGHRMLARSGVTTCLDMAGPLDDILDNIPEYGAGLNVAILQFASPPFTFKTAAPTKAEMVDLIEKSLKDGAFGVKLLGGHYPLTPTVSSELIQTALERGCYVAWHAGTTEHGSNIEGMVEAVDMAGSAPLHLAHINAYCRGAVRPELEETKIAIDSADVEGVKKAFLAGHAWAVYDAGGYSDLMTGEKALRYWEEKKTDVGGSFNVNPPLPRVWLSEAKRPDGSFVVDAISTDGGCIPRNVILSQGLSLVKLGILTLPEFVVKTSLNPAHMLRLGSKGHLSVGADADVTVYDYATQSPVGAFVAGDAIFLNGKITGKSARIICTERGAESIAERGLKAIVADPSQPYGPRFVLPKG